MLYLQCFGWVAQSVEQRTENQKTPFSLRCAAFSDHWPAQCLQGFMHFCLLQRQTAFCFENAFGYTIRDTKENSPASNPLLPLSKPSNRGFKPASHGLRFCSLFVYREIIHCNLAPSGTDSHPRIQPAIILSVLIPNLAINGYLHAGVRDCPDDVVPYIRKNQTPSRNSCIPYGQWIANSEF